MKRSNKMLSIRAVAYSTLEELMTEYSMLKEASDLMVDRGKPSVRAIMVKSNSLLISICCLKSVIMLIDGEIKRLESTNPKPSP